MSSNRSKISYASLALASALALVSSSCLSGSGSHHATPAVRAGTGTDHAFSRSEAQNELEYFEGETPPETPLALPEQRPGAPSPAHVWIAGYHTRRAGQWVWVSGHYALPPRTDVVWVPGHWVSHLHGYAWIPGAWR